MRSNQISRHQENAARAKHAVIAVAGSAEGPLQDHGGSLHPFQVACLLLDKSLDASPDSKNVTAIRNELGVERHAAILVVGVQGGKISSYDLTRTRSPALRFKSANGVASLAGDGSPIPGKREARPTGIGRDRRANRAGPAEFRQEGEASVVIADIKKATQHPTERCVS